MDKTTTKSQPACSPSPVYLKHLAIRPLLLSITLALAACGGGSGSEDTAAKQPDADNDTILDASDSCPNTPTELISQINAQGCHIDEITDSDSDSVFNVADQCPNTPESLKGVVNNQGCHADELADDDSDQIVNALDQCLATPSTHKDNVNTHGCHTDEITDTDDDKVYNISDVCPNTPSEFKGAVDNQGCHANELLDDDNDTIKNALDQCPSTPASLKDAVNAQGCHSDEITDTDQDGVMNAFDTCPATPSNVPSVDANGCDNGNYYHTVAAINVGNREFITKDGTFFQRDKYAQGWTKIERSGVVVTGNKETDQHDILNTEDDDLFRHHRFLYPKADGTANAVRYAIPVANGNYVVKLYFAELNWQLNGQGKRLLDVLVENQKVLSNIDLAGDHGLRTAYTPMTDEFAVSDGVLNVTVESAVGGPTLSAIQVMQLLATNGDEDGDSVLNPVDQCVFTDNSLIANVSSTTGCAPEEQDDDYDGVLNAIDTCPNTKNLMPTFPASELNVDSKGCALSDIDSDNDGVNDGKDLCANTSTSDINSVDNLGCATSQQASLNKPFQETDGLVIVEMEAANLPSNSKWKIYHGRFATGDHYLQHDGGWNTNTTQADRLVTVDVNITTPGVYRFLWRSLITHGYLGSEGNDSWLSIQSSLDHKFYGQGIKDNNKTKVICPASAIAENKCVQTGHREGNVVNFFKVFRNNQPTWDWNYATLSNGGDTYAKYLEVTNPGVYQIMISGRSQGHAIDRVMLYRDAVYNSSGKTYTFAEAANPDLPASAR
ncbi:malectin domain-containing carbohydrate-binding protein [Saccharobesus litoralis]|nr:malectin domain-containing carbohydrate-binding protein [Saccharobesus litoralis]